MIEYNQRIFISYMSSGNKFRDYLILKYHIYTIFSLPFLIIFAQKNICKCRNEEHNSTWVLVIIVITFYLFSIFNKYYLL